MSSPARDYAVEMGRGPAASREPPPRRMVSEGSPTRGAAAGIGRRDSARKESRGEDQKVDQIVQHFYAKVCAVIAAGRMDEDAGGSIASRRTNKWFNLELPETDLFKSELRTWRSVSTQPSTPPMILTLILDTSDLTANQVLVLSSAGRRIRVGEKGGRGRSHVVLEEWTLALGDPDPESSTKGMELPTVYKQSIMFFRSLYTTLHSLPAASLTKRLGRGRGGAGIKIGLRMSMGADDAGKEGLIGMGERVGEEELGTVEESVDWATVDTPLGSLRLHCRYRVNAEFGVEDIETLLSSRFIDEDFFRPTIARYQSRDDAEVLRPGSLPIRTPLPPLQTSSPPARLPSYGSLSSRHHLSHAPLPIQPPTAALAAYNLNSEPSVNPINVPLPPETTASGVSSGRYSYQSGVGGGVEPAFVSMSRARGVSFLGGIQRANQPISSSPPSARHPSFSSTSSSPLFRASSYLSSPPPILSSSPSSFSRLSRAQMGTTVPRAIPTPSSSATGAPSSSQHMRQYTSGSYSRSYGRGSSVGSAVGGEGGWAGPESLGRRAVGGSRLSFEGRRGGVEEKTAEEVESIQAFLGMIERSGSLGGKGGERGMGEAEEQLKRLAGSVYGAGGIEGVEDHAGAAKNLVKRRSSRLSIVDKSPLFLAATPPSTSLDDRITTSPSSRVPIAPAVSNSPYFPPIPPSSSSPISFPRYNPHPRSGPSTLTTGFELPTTSRGTASSSNAASILSTSGGGSGSYGGEEEAVGTLELGDESEEVVPVVRREYGVGGGGGRWTF